MQISGIDVDSLHVSPEVAAQVLRDAHAQGALPHHWMLDLPGSVLEIAVGATQRCWIGADLRSGIGRKPTVANPLMAAAPISFNFRPADILGSEGICGTGMLNMAILMSAPINRGSVPDKFMNSIRLDFSPTTAADLTLYPASPVPEEVVKGRILDFVKLVFSGTYPLPVGLSDAIKRTGALQVVTTRTPVPQIVIRQLEIPRDARGRRIFSPDPVAGVAFNPNEGASWTVVANATTLGASLARLALAARRVMWRGSVAPRDSVPQQIATIPGAITVLENDSQGSPARKMKIVPKAAAEGKVLCEVHDVTGEKAKRAQPGTLDLLKSLSSSDSPDAGESMHLQRAFGFRLTASLLHCEIGKGEVRFKGFAFRDAAAEMPVADYSWYRQVDTVATVTFYGMTSWSPADAVVQAVWDFGDGSLLSSSGEQLAMVVSHTFATAGAHTCTLTIIDSNGRQAVKTRTVDPAAVRLAFATPLVTASRKLSTRVRVTCGNSPAAGGEMSFRHSDLAPASGGSSYRIDRDGFVSLRECGRVPYGFAGDGQRGVVPIGTKATVAISWEGRAYTVDLKAVDIAMHDEVRRTTQICNRAIGSLSRLPPSPRSVRLSAVAEKARRALQLGHLPAWYRGKQADAVEPSSSSSQDDIRSLGRHISDALMKEFFL